MNNEEKLYEVVLYNSISQEIDTAKKEWELHEIYFEPRGVCSCSKNPIFERCIIENKLNGNKLLVGNCCVKKFLGIDTGNFFNCIKRMRKDITKSPNDDVIKVSLSDGVIDQNEVNDLEYMKRFLSFEDLTKKTAINKKIIAMYTRHTVYEESVYCVDYELKRSKFNDDVYTAVTYTMSNGYTIRENINIKSQKGKKWWMKRTNIKTPHNNKTAFEHMKSHKCLKETSMIRWEILPDATDRIIKEKI